MSIKKKKATTTSFVISHNIAKTVSHSRRGRAIGSVDNAPSDVQLELTDLQCDAYWQSILTQDHCWILTLSQGGELSKRKETCSEDVGSLWLLHMWKYILSDFAKSRYRSSLSDDHLAAVLHISTSDLQPDFDALVNAPTETRFLSLNWKKSNEVVRLEMLARKGTN